MYKIFKKEKKHILYCLWRMAKQCIYLKDCKRSPSVLSEGTVIKCQLSMTVHKARRCSSRRCRMCALRAWQWWWTSVMIFSWLKMISIGEGWRKESERGREKEKREIEKFAKKKNPIVLVSKCIVVKASVNSDGFTFTVSACSGIEM